VAVLDLDASSRALSIPDEDVHVQRSTSKMNVVRGPGQGVDTGGVEDPSLVFDGFALDIPEDDLTVSVTGSQQFAVGAEGNGRERASVAFEFGGLVEGVARQGVEIDVLVVTTDGDIGSVGRDGDSTRSVRGRDGGGDGLVLEDDDAVVGHSDGGITVFSDADGMSRAINGDAIRGESSAIGSSEADRVVKSSRNKVTTTDLDLVDLVGVSFA
jgi:hypothetical protein